MASRQPDTRRRGVRASRAKLYRALSAVGLKTQAALADRIAHQEGLESPPKDTINRVFRELPVEVQTLERVARALGVEAYSLYRSSDDAVSFDPAGAAGPGNDAAEPHPVERRDAADDHRARSGGWWGRRSRRFAATAAGLACLGLIVWIASLDFGNRNGADALASWPVPGLDLGSPTLQVLSIDGDSEGLLAESVREGLAESFQVASATANVLTESLPPGAAARRLRTDVTVDGAVVPVGRLVGVRFYLFEDGVRRQIWAESLPRAVWPEHRQAVAGRLVAAVLRATGRSDTGLQPHFPPAAAQDDYLAGRQYLDMPSNELNVKRAQSRFDAALRKDDRYAAAHGGLCEALLEEHWMGDEARILRDAAAVCTRGLELEADDPVVAAAHAQFLRRTGRNQDAIDVYRQVVTRHPNDAWALTGLASSLLHAYRQDGGRHHLEEAIATAARAAEIDAFAWKPAFTLASLEWFAGNVSGAIDASELALERDENEFVLANLGTFYLCDGDYERARNAYQRARDLAPASYVGDEFLGQALYYLGDFPQSAELRRAAIERIADGEPEIHEMWGNLGDSLRLAGDHAGALDAYLRAAEILERDALRGNAPMSDQAARAFYYTTIRVLDPARVSASLQHAVAGQLDEISHALTEATAHVRAAQTWRQLGEIERARESLARAMATCRGYAGHPDLRALAADPVIAKHGAPDRAPTDAEAD